MTGGGDGSKRYFKVNNGNLYEEKVLRGEKNRTKNTGAIDGYSIDQLTQVYLGELYPRCHSPEKCSLIHFEYSNSRSKPLKLNPSKTVGNKTPGALIRVSSYYGVKRITSLRG